MPTNPNLKETIIKSLPELIAKDASFRKAVLRLVRGKFSDRRQTEDRFDKLLAELKRDREEQSKKWEEHRQQDDKKWEEHRQQDDIKWEEHRQQDDKKWREHLQQDDKKWGEHLQQDDIKWEEQSKKWEEHLQLDEKKWEEQNKKWEQNQKVINEILVSIKNIDVKFERRLVSTIGALGARWGLHSEESFRSALASILSESFGMQVQRYQDFDHEGRVFGRPEQIEMDIIIHNGLLIICEIKSAISKADMHFFWSKKLFYEEKHNRKASRTIVISPMVDAQAKNIAKTFGIELFSYVQDVNV